ncbi:MULTISPECIES: hypothetical protein [Streptomyces]|uniref:Uncharacterized protein n=1 Tax=Streptomyces spororaveus TaxID=284039 RepID=A0ABQ3T9G4_9ACTN|nr:MULTISPECIES: hypothetical protein [Streptomyces]MCM9082533.1 hypothetical protein [Streptomyces spororaveus]MCX5302891.1 hypothetical protein [Streptomyces sp. NBC_00160]GHI77048.1 hypothetical protein Sspor_26090 [Streptomyces spororaveus]
MAMSPRSKPKTMRTRYRGALTVIAAVLTLAACDPATPAGTPSTSAAVTASTSAGPSAVATSPSPSESPTPSAAPTTAAPTPAATTEAPAAKPTAYDPPPTKAAPAPPAPTRTRTQAPAPAPTKAATDCYPRSNAGNCYRAGQICRKADVGSSGRDANGRAIHCRHDDSVGQRWGY